MGVYMCVQACACMFMHGHVHGCVHLCVCVLCMLVCVKLGSQEGSRALRSLFMSDINTKQRA